ncbi:hypothetical protein V3D52_06675 [Pseudomonas putida]|uniref:hypothetical protein n=1 Tax=Pseudomonas putida TaxID=303 RepID=UPI0030CC5C3E
MFFTQKKLISIALFSPLTGLCAPVPISIEIRPGSPETVFDWKNDRCFDENIPDSPARAFRSKDGQVHLYATHFKNVPLKGPTVDSVKPECRTNFAAAFSSVPESYDARIWLQTFYSIGSGKDIYSLGSSDYHGKWFNKCTLKGNTNQDCWMSAIVLAHSSDGGQSFSMAAPPNHIIANSPEKFSGEQAGSAGFLTTSNIVKIDNYFYALFYASSFKKQRGGNCLARTNDLADPKSWRAWSGRYYDEPLFNGPRGNSGGHTCIPLATLPYKIRSLLWHSSSQGYISTFEKTRKINNPSPRIDVEFSFAWSKDLINWSEPATIMTLEGPSNCKTPQVSGAYPSIIDGQSTDKNFGTVADQANLYFTKFNLQPDCRLTLDRDLVKVPIRIRTISSHQR